MYSRHSIHRLVFSLLAIVLLVTAFGCSSTQSTGGQVSDSWITTKIESKLAADPQVSAMNVDVDTRDGVVRLSGKVKTDQARREAEDLARDTKGVQRVLNEIEVGERKLGERVDDAVISSKIKAKLISDPQINPFNIDVDVHDGVVTLTGRVTSDASKEEAEDLARDTKGVKDVHNRIEVGDG